MNEEIDILLVEDNIYDAELAIRALKKMNRSNTLVHLHDGAEVSDFLFGTGNYSERNISYIPKVIFLDLKMLKMNGAEVLKILKSDERSKKIPVVVFTSSKEVHDIDTCYTLGANSYIVKPVAYDEFSKTVTDAGFYWLELNQL